MATVHQLSSTLEEAQARANAQRHAALENANRLRRDSAELKREVRSGTLSLPDALYDPRAGVLSVFSLCKAQAGWGRRRVLTLLAAHHISESRRVRELTKRQRAQLAADDRFAYRKWVRAA